ncbi:MAG TPA: endonuclease/exonuclease/phosphatase family protein [Woeseiaceae bacterium]|nr:endonuclease/exonuclease/phosphatase family protein [Woeseiaceae bacterium]
MSNTVLSEIKQLARARRDRRGLASFIGMRGLDSAVMFAAVAALLLTALSSLGSRYWLLELLTHFRVQLATGAVVLVVLTLVRRRSGSLIMTSVVAVANLAPVWAFTMSGGHAESGGAESALRVMSLNVNLRNFDYGQALALVENEHPDIVGFLEVNKAWTDHLSGLQATYPYSVLQPEEGAYGIALYSRFPLRELDASPYVEANVQAALLADVALKGGEVRLILAHLLAPTSKQKAAVRNLQIETIAEKIRNESGREHILLGDLNITPWSPHYVQLVEAGLQNAARGRGYWPTWPAGINPLKIPIDHCLVSDGIEVQQFRTSADFGSDHLAIIADVALAGSSSSAPGTRVPD